MPLVALIVGTAALGSEIEDGTAVYLMIKPVPRWQIGLAKMIVAAGLTAALIVPAILISGFLLVAVRTRRDVFAFALAGLIGGTAYAVAFVTLSVFTSRALLVGLAYTLLWEGVLQVCSKGRASSRSVRRRWAWPMRLVRSCRATLSRRWSA